MAIINGTARDDVLNGTDENDTIRGFGGNDALFGGGGDDFLAGGPGNDRLDGNRGADRMLGEAGNDLYYVNDLRDTVTEATPGGLGGIDRVFASVSFILGDNLEHLTMFGAAQLGRGNDLANIIRGNASDNVLQGLRGDDVIFGGLGDDRLDGGLGADTMTGGRGDDAYFADSRLDVIVEGALGGIDTLFTSDSRRLDANVENLTMYGTARNAVGNELDNQIIGNSASNVILGELGDDTISGGKGDDNIRGGAGDDVISGGLINPTIENFTVLSDELMPLYADDGADFIDGGDGEDTLVFVDIFNDDIPFTVSAITQTFEVNLASGVVQSVEYPESVDILNSIENITLGSGNDLVYGSDIANIIRPGDGDNRVFAGDGDDVIIGGSGYYSSSLLDGENFSNKIVEVLRGEDGDDVIFSNQSYVRYEDFGFADAAKTRDLLFGGNGDDRLVGGSGLITMIGGEGADTFEFFDNSFFSNDEFGFIDLNGDVSHITDFNVGAGDSIKITREAGSEIETIFVGESNNVGLGELGYERVTRGDTTTTIVRHGFEPSSGGDDLSYSTIILDNYAGPLTESDFLIV